MAEARPILSDVGRLPPFDFHGDINSVGIRWTRWIRSFELFATAKGVQDHEQKKSLLLHMAGLGVQDVYYTLEVPEPGERQNVYGVALTSLNAHFAPQVNHTFERFQFRAMTQTSNETIERHITTVSLRTVTQPRFQNPFPELPDIQKLNDNDHEARDRDSERKEKEKLYSDKKRKAVMSDLKEDDMALMRRNLENKLSANYYAEPLKVVKKNGNSVTLESSDGVHYKRNITHTKKFVSEPSNVCESGDIPKPIITEENLESKSEIENENMSKENLTANSEIPGIQETDFETEAVSTFVLKPTRPIRQRTLPAKFKDYILD